MLIRKSSGRMRGLSRKQVFAWGELWVRVPRLPPLHVRSARRPSGAVASCYGSEQEDPVVQRQRLLAYNQETMVRVHPGLLSVFVRRGESAACVVERFAPAG